MNILLIDNFDSFTHILADYLAKNGDNVEIKRNNALVLTDIYSQHYDLIVISPGPGVPSEAGLSMAVLRQFAGKVPIFGVCLGHQAIVEFLGGRLMQAQEIMHGKTSVIWHHEKGLFAGVKNPLTVARYHSWVADESFFPSDLIITAKTTDHAASIMAIEHRRLPLWGVQFHPEAILTEEGQRIIQNMLLLTEKFSAVAKASKV